MDQWIANPPSRQQVITDRYFLFWRSGIRDLASGKEDILFFTG